MRRAMTPQEAARAFADWFRWHGHWVYASRADAVETWRTRGIVGRPEWTAAREAALSAWVDADPTPALLAQLDAMNGSAVLSGMSA